MNNVLPCCMFQMCFRFAFVEFTSVEEASAVIESKHGSIFEGRTMYCSFAEERRGTHIVTFVK